MKAAMQAYGALMVPQQEGKLLSRTQVQLQRFPHLQSEGASQISQLSFLGHHNLGVGTGDTQLPKE